MKFLILDKFRQRDGFSGILLSLFDIIIWYHHDDHQDIERVVGLLSRHELFLLHDLLLYMHAWINWVKWKDLFTKLFLNAKGRYSYKQKCKKLHPTPKIPVVIYSFVSFWSIFCVHLSFSLWNSAFLWKIFQKKKPKCIK